MFEKTWFKLTSIFFRWVEGNHQLAGYLLDIGDYTTPIWLIISHYNWIPIKMVWETLGNSCTDGLSWHLPTVGFLISIFCNRLGAEKQVEIQEPSENHVFFVVCAKKGIQKTKKNKKTWCLFENLTSPSFNSQIFEPLRNFEFANLQPQCFAKCYPLRKCHCNHQWWFFISKMGESLLQWFFTMISFQPMFGRKPCVSRYRVHVSSPFGSSDLSFAKTQLWYKYLLIPVLLLNQLFQWVLLSMEEIRPSPDEVGSLSHHLQGF